MTNWAKFTLRKANLSFYRFKFPKRSQIPKAIKTKHPCGRSLHLEALLTRNTHICALLTDITCGGSFGLSHNRANAFSQIRDPQEREHAERIKD
ncbi:hypothetical protein CEXT_156511 [Caerostris extrusa]|uniref:Uncharacterized protein n=1 Tax=Caerostris extrusa TaxID=172846 RepID=A0AAV4TT99_CAEEX|nr:hypothetical protein CEXT_156511 [Caerostris extrusa]